jgi:hypothetical protein
LLPERVEDQMALSIDQPEATDLRSVTTVKEPIIIWITIDGTTYDVDIH